MQIGCLVFTRGRVHSAYPRKDVKINEFILCFALFFVLLHPKVKYDVIIIGSGLGGLACGVTLSRQGKRVLVLERQWQPGGCMQSYKRQGCMLDTGLHYVGGLDEGQPLHDAFKELGLLDLPWQRLNPEGFDEITIEGKTYRFKQGYGNFVEELAKDFPEEREGLEKYVEMLQTTDELWLQQTNAYDYLRSIIHSPLLISIISGASLKMELRKKTLPLFTFAHGNASFIESSWRLRGDGNMLVKRLTEQIEQQGGEIICHADVTELREQDGRITQAICRDGRTFEADTFISDTHPTVTVNMIKESRLVKKIYRMRMTTMKNTCGMFTLQLKLKPDTLKYFNHNKFVYATSDVWAGMAVEPEHPEVKGVLISCPVNGNVNVNSYAKVIDILTPMKWEYVEQWADKTPGKRGEDYVAMKQDISRQCMALAEQVIPGLSEMVERSYTSTPLTYYTYNNSPQGSAYGLRKDYSNPLGTILSPKTPIPNLFLTGQSLMLHGLHGVVMTTRYTCEAVLGN